MASDRSEPTPFNQGRFDAVFRRETGRCTATLVRILGDIDLAEDAVAEAFAIAAERWPGTGIPPNPGGWITTTARNRAIDRLRREAMRQDRERESTKLYGPRGGPTAGRPINLLFGDVGWIDAVADDQLRLIFLCCHPALAPDAQVALTLRLVGGLTTGEIARAFLVPEATMAQRISRAKAKIRDTHMAYRIPAGDQLRSRLDAVLATVYLIFTEGHNVSVGPDLDRTDLADEAIRIGYVLNELLPEEPEIVGLVALMVLTRARRPARLDGAGGLVRLADQDRSLWDRRLIEDGHRLVRWCLDRNQPGPYQIQAAIAAVHADAANAGQTDWGQILALYDQLHQVQPTAIVALNRAVAVLEHVGPDAALAELDSIDLGEYHLYHATRAEVLARSGRPGEAGDALRRAVALTANTTERRHLESRLAELQM
jgi:RNA polymerase sigma-70 factor (ECF subfamily)